MMMFCISGLMKSHEKMIPQYSDLDGGFFNIFDGSNPDPSSPFSRYIYDADEEEFDADQDESMRWEVIQDHV
jgi:hypothetical protein